MNSARSGPIHLATRGSALALAQAGVVRDALAALFPSRNFELRVIKTTGDQRQTAAWEAAGEALPKGLFTKELEAALLSGDADLAVHSLKDLPTELPAGLCLGATPRRADAREVLLCRGSELAPKFTDWSPGRPAPFYSAMAVGLSQLPRGQTVGTSSARRQAQFQAFRADLKLTPWRGNVGTRLRRLVETPDVAATLLAAAGLGRLGWQIASDGRLRLDRRVASSGAGPADPPPEGVLASAISIEDLLPAAGQGIVGIERRSDDPLAQEWCAGLNHQPTWLAAIAERAFLREMGGGCQTPMAAHARIAGHRLKLRAGVYGPGGAREVEFERPSAEAEELGRQAARRLHSEADDRR